MELELYKKFVKILFDKFDFEVDIFNDFHIYTKLFSLDEWCEIAVELNEEDAQVVRMMLELYRNDKD